MNDNESSKIFPSPFHADRTRTGFSPFMPFAQTAADPKNEHPGSAGGPFRPLVYVEPYFRRHDS